MRLRWFFEAAGVALLVSFPYFAELLFPGDIALYHHHLHFRTLIEGLLLAVFIVFLLAMAAIAYFHYRFAPKPRAIATAAFVSIILLRLVDSMFLLFDHWFTNLNPNVSELVLTPGYISTANHYWSLWYLRVLVVFSAVAVAWWKPTMAALCSKWARIGLAAFAFNLLWVVPQLLHLALALNQVRPFDNSTTNLVSANNPRIVWILLDELSYDQSFEHRAPDLALPNLDKFRAKSTTFTDLQPIGFFTDRIVPSLLAGKRINSIRSDAHGKLFYLDTATNSWLTYDSNQTLFGLAKSDGWRSGIVGWFNPYCRIFKTYLTTCSWDVGELVGGLPLEKVGASEDKSILANAAALVPVFLTSVAPQRVDLPAQRVRTYKSMFGRAQSLINNGQLNFVFIHLSAPHPPGFYDRKTHHFCACGDYIDNLVLADDTLGILMNDIDRTPWGDQTTVIVTSDHSWRIPLWRGGERWSPEEENLTKGRFDKRPVLLVHFPGQTAGSEIMTPVPEMIEHDMVAAMLQHKMETPTDLQNMADAERSQTSTPTSKLP